MPNIKSAKKRMRQAVVRRLKNRARKSEMRTQVKAFRRMVADGKIDEARAALPAVYSSIDQTAQKGSIHRNTGARYKARLNRLLRAQASS